MIEVLLTVWQVGDAITGGGVTKTVYSWFGVSSPEELVKRLNNLKREVQGHVLMGMFDYTNNVIYIPATYKAILDKCVNRKSETTAFKAQAALDAQGWLSTLTQLRAQQSKVTADIGPKVLTYLWQKTESDSSPQAQRVRKLITDLSTGIYVVPDATAQAAGVGKELTLDELPVLITRYVNAASDGEAALWKGLAMQPISDGSHVDTAVSNWKGSFAPLSSLIVNFINSYRSFLEAGTAELRSLIAQANIPAELPGVTVARASDPTQVYLTGEAPGGVIPLIVGGILLFLTNQ